MAKAQSPLLGFNNNVKHRGVLFHIQTEDSGIKHPHVITHLFADGGRIVKTSKSSYADKLGEDSVADVVRAMMKDQHKAMFIALRDGQFDDLIDQGALGPSAPQAQAVQAPALDRPSRIPDPPGFEHSPAADATALAHASLAPAAAATSPNGQSSSSFPGATTTGTFKAPAAAGHRYVASRPAAIFASRAGSHSRPSFGSEIISDKSLDQVILSFLAEELRSDPTDKKSK